MSVSPVTHTSIGVPLGTPAVPGEKGFLEHAQQLMLEYPDATDPVVVDETKFYMDHAIPADFERKFEELAQTDLPLEEKAKKILAINKTYSLAPDTEAENDFSQVIDDFVEQNPALIDGLLQALSAHSLTEAHEILLRWDLGLHEGLY